MRRSMRKAGVACGAVFASAAIALSTSTGASAVTTAVAVGGLGTPDMHEVVIRPLLGGKLARENTILDGVEWPAEAKRPGTGRTLGQSITEGIASLDTHFDAAVARLAVGEQFTVVGFSAGSLVVNDFMRELAKDPNAPTKSQVKFILVADSSRQKLIQGSSKYNPQYDYTYQPAPETIYDIDVVTGEYDGAADMPDRIFNFLAVVNAIAGGIFVHVPMMFEDYAAVTPEENITTVTNSKGGTTTTYLVPTKTLPIVQLLPFLKSQEASLKAKIDAGYSRNDDRTTTPTTAARSAAAPEVQAVSATVEDEADVEDTKDVAESDDTAADADESDRQSTKASKREALAEEDADASKSDEDEAEATEAADEADSDTAKDDEGDKESSDSDSSGGSSSDGSGSSDSGSSE